MVRSFVHGWLLNPEDVLPEGNSDTLFLTTFSPAISLYICSK